MALQNYNYIYANECKLILNFMNYFTPFIIYLCLYFVFVNGGFLENVSTNNLINLLLYALFTKDNKILQV